MRSLTLLLSLWLLPASAGLTVRADNLEGASTGDGVAVSISSPFSTLPPGGCVPFQVNLRNDGSSSATWQIRFRGFSGAALGTTILARDLTVAGNSTGKFDLLVPLPTPVAERSGQSLYLYPSVSGPGFSNNNGKHLQEFANFNTGGNLKARTPFTLLGKQLLGNIGTGALESLCSDQGESFYGSQVEVTTLPSDWRAYAGVASILLKDSEWTELDRGQRDAISDYVAQGGWLTIFTPTGDATGAPALQLPTPDGKPGPYGFGNIKLLTDSIPPGADLLYSTLSSNHATPASEVDRSFSTWDMRAWAGTIAISAAFILAFILVFGALIGPINLFVFARGARRIWLFWTTPLISLGASLVLVLGILFTDGIGGKGKQMVAFFSLPAANRQAVIQEQVARTAVLFSNRWSNTQNYLITPVSEEALSGSVDRDDGGYNYHRTLGNRDDSAENYEQNGSVLSGSWFRSRSVSGQYLQAMVPSRSVLTVLNPAAPAAGQEAPVLLSSFAEVLSLVYLIDLNGNYWTCRDLSPGQKKTCAACSFSDYETFWSNLYKQAGGKLRPALMAAGGRPGCFYATGPTSPAETLATLSEIRWEVADGIYLGPWVASPTPENTP